MALARYLQTTALFNSVDVLCAKFHCQQGHCTYAELIWVVATDLDVPERSAEPTRTLLAWNLTSKKELKP